MIHDILMTFNDSSTMRGQAGLRCHGEDQGPPRGQRHHGNNDITADHQSVCVCVKALFSLT